MKCSKFIFIVLTLVSCALAAGPAFGNSSRSLSGKSGKKVRLGSFAATWDDDRPEVPFDIRGDIRKAQELLGRQRSGYTARFETAVLEVKNRRGKIRKKIVRKKIVEPAFLLAVEDLRKRSLRLVRFTSKGCETPGYDVVMTRDNGVGSRFEVRSPENMAVLALRTMVRSATGNGYREVVYTPYSREIDTRDVREDGLSYLRQQIESARSDLEERGVRLKGFEGLPVEITATDVSLALSIVEHIDPQRFKNAGVGKEIDLVHEVLTIVGANTVHAYAYSKSSAGARGLFQFIPGTYEKILRKYRSAGLLKDFVSGTTSHVNAAKASLLLFDSDLKDLPDDYPYSIGTDVRSLGRYLAAAYNCGSKRAERSARICANEWTCRLPAETKNYLDKFDVVWDFLRF